MDDSTRSSPTAAELSTGHDKTCIFFDKPIRVEHVQMPDYAFEMKNRSILDKKACLITLFETSPCL